MYGSPRRLDIISCGQAALAALRPRCPGTRGTALAALRCARSAPARGEPPLPRCPALPRPAGNRHCRAAPLYSRPAGNCPCYGCAALHRPAGNCPCRATPALLPARRELTTLAAPCRAAPARGEPSAPRCARSAPLCAGAGKTGSSARAPGRVKTLSESAAR